MTDTERRLAAVLAEHAMVSGFDEIGVWFKYACGCAATGDSDEWHRAHLAAALLPVVAEIEAEARVRALREAAMDARSAPSTRVGDRHSGEVWTDWLHNRADSIARTAEGAE